MDLIGKLRTTTDGNQYICTMIDYFTKWSIAFPLKTKSASKVVQCIIKLFYLFGAPKRILTDQGKEFCNKLNKEITDLQIRRSYTSAYHPQTNGLVERLNGSIQRSLRKLVDEKPDTLDTYLDAVVFRINTKKQITTKYSPFFVIWKRGTVSQ